MTPPPINIITIQQKFIDAGYQWTEHIFNDGREENCMIDFAMSKDPSYFSHNSGDFGWGRFTREYCWDQAETWLEQRKQTIARRALTGE